MLDRLRRLVARLEAWAQSDFLADSEADSDRSGYLSWRAEWHAAAWGFAAGLLAGVTGAWPLLVAAVGWVVTRPRDPPGWLPYPRQFVRESGYLLGHAAAGVLVGVVLRVVVL